MLPNVTKTIPLKEKQKSFIEFYIKNMGNISKACEEIGITRMTYYRWMKKEKFKVMYDSALEKHNDLIFQRILKLALESDKDMLKFWARTQMRHRGFIEKQEIEHTGDLNTPVEVNIIMPNDEKENKLQANNKAGKSVKLSK